MIESKVGHDAQCIKQAHCLFSLDCTVCGCHYRTSQSAELYASHAKMVSASISSY